MMVLNAKTFTHNVVQEFEEQRYAVSIADKFIVKLSSKLANRQVFLLLAHAVTLNSICAGRENASQCLPSAEQLYFNSPDGGRLPFQY